MKALVVGIGLAVATVLTLFSPVMGGAAMAFGAKNVKTYDAQGNALTHHQLSVKKELARTKAKQG